MNELIWFVLIFQIGLLFGSNANNYNKELNVEKSTSFSSYCWQLH